MNSWFTEENLFSLASNGALIVASLMIFVVQVKKYIKKFFDELKTDVPGRIKNQMQIDATILQKMNEVRDLVNGDRILVFEFHNKEHYANGREALRMTCTYESSKITLMSIKDKIVGLGLSQFPIFLNKLFENDIFYWNEMEEIKKKMPNSYGFLNQFDIQSGYCHVLKNKYRQPIGFVMIVYHKPTNIHLETDSEEVARLSYFIEEQIQNMSEDIKNKKGGKNGKIFKSN